MSFGVYVLGSRCPGGKSAGGKCPGGICPWGKCPWGICPTGFCPVTTLYNNPTCMLEYVLCNLITWVAMKKGKSRLNKLPE